MLEKSQATCDRLLRYMRCHNSTLSDFSSIRVESDAIVIQNVALGIDANVEVTFQRPLLGANNGPDYAYKLDLNT